MGPVVQDGELNSVHEDLSALEVRIGYSFKDRALLDLALSHISAVKGEAPRVRSYQRLEFLGDHVLGSVVSHMLYDAFPQAEEGELSRRLAELVREEACADVAADMNLGAHIRLGPGETQSGTHKRRAILADVTESVVAAVFLDGGYPAANALVERYWRQRLEAPRRPLRDAKTVLQEWAQARGLPPPSYREVARSGPDHAPRFTVAVDLPGLETAEAEGNSKQAAQKAAATAFLVREGVWNSNAS
ncbi:ribonuclease III [Xanthobacter agilis]|jgi:ribonuclease-3|uniref:Ribonuclease 3 n=1 Tax=Xanthobacter agilis TaxID=47492 RepID=A0ABU0LB05_XANAG|nr:ribonuclease III [Xanthobacter agilis]MDQ0504320.1 ribonuclease-3 [Xanthobacter agilis]